MGLKARRDPFEMLEKSHRRLEDHLALLTGDDALDHVADVAAFFDRSVARHERDEEESLFPRLRHHASVAAMIGTLTAEHRGLERLHVRLRAEVARPSKRRVRALARELSARYSRHIHIEDQQLFPAARRLLTRSERIDIGAEMQARRGRG